MPKETEEEEIVVEGLRHTPEGKYAEVDDAGTIYEPANVNPNIPSSVLDDEEEASRLTTQEYYARRGGLGAPDLSMIEKAYRFGWPLAVEIGGPLATAIVASPMMISPVPGSRVGYFSLLGAAANLSNIAAQQIRIGFGDQEEFSWEENAAATGFGMIPGLISTKGMTKVGMAAVRAGEGATMATGETATRQGLEIASGKRESMSAGELLAAAGIGTLLGGGMGRLEHALTKQVPKETPDILLRRILKDEVKEAEKALKAAGKTGDVDKIQDAQDWVLDAKGNLEKITPKEEVILGKAIEELDKIEAETARIHQEAALDLRTTRTEQVVRESLKRAEEGQARTEIDLPAVKERLPDDLRRAKPRYSVGKGTNYGLEFDNDVDRALFIVRNKKGRSKRDDDYMKFLRPLFEGKTDDEIRALGDRVANELIKPAAMAKPEGSSLKVPRFHGVGEALDLPLTTTVQKSASDMARETTAPKTSEEPPPLPDETADKEGKEILDDFMEGKGTREAELDPKTGEEIAGDASDEIKARLLSNDEDVQRMINVIQDHMKDELNKVKGKISKEEFLQRVADRVKLSLGREEANAYQMLVNSRLTAETKEIAEAVEDAAIRMGATASLIDSAFVRITNNLKDADLSDSATLNDAMVAIHKSIPLMLEWKRLGSASGRLLVMRKHVKDAQEVRFQEAEKQITETLVKDLKSSDKLTPEQLKAQIETFGDLQVVRRLVKAIQQADNVEEVKKILMDQQQAFQTTSSVKNFFGKEKIETRYTKVRDVAIDFLYSSMLSSPITAMKTLIGNVTMQYYHPFLGYAGAKYMAIAPWARRGKSKAEYQAAATFWKDTGTNKAARVYGNYTALAFDEAKKAFVSGDADLASHFERVGASALSMERTGLDGALGQSLENLGQLVDIPGKTLTGIDGFTKLRMAHSMAYAKAHHDWSLAQKAGKEVPEFDEYYQGFLKKVFAENKLKTEDVVRREAVRMAEEQGVPFEKYPEFIDNYVKENWDTATSDFVNYIQRESKEVAFQEALGEFTNINKLEEFIRKGEGAITDFSPIVQTVLFPFMRTGRNILREAVSHSAFLAETPLVGKYVDGMWAKTMQDLNSGDPIRASRAKGRQIVGAGMMATIYGLYEAGILVGKEEQNWRKRENLETGTKLGDYEVRLPLGPNGETVGIDYTTLEPFATVAGIICDSQTIWRTGNEEQKEAVVVALQAVSLTIANNISNKSYYKNLGTVLKLLSDQSDEGGAENRNRKLRSLMSVLVPSGMNAMEMATDDTRRRGDTAMQVVAKRMAGIAQVVPAYRDLFGDPTPLHAADFGTTGAKASQVFSWLFPFKIRKERMKVDDYVVVDDKGFRSIDVSKVNLKNKEDVRNAAWAIMIELGGEYHFPTPSKDGVDLSLLRNKDGQDAYDRWQELFSEIKMDGLGIKQRVVRTLKIPELKRIKTGPKKGVPEGVSLSDRRHKAVQKALGIYREFAYEKLEREFPILKEIEKDTLKRQMYQDYGKREKAVEGQSPLERFLEEENPPDPVRERLDLFPGFNNNQQ
jgi:nitrogen regulatory protein PII